MGSVQLTYVGHQTWLVEGGGHAVLVDPVLESAFGLGDAFRVWPPRTVETGSMPRLDAVALTHEHLDHFHPASLDRLDRSVPVCTGPMLPAAVEDAITALGFSVRRIDHRGVVAYGDLTMRLYPAGGKTLFWENRVVQPVVRCGDGPAVFIGVDAEQGPPRRARPCAGWLRPARATRPRCRRLPRRAACALSSTGTTGQSPPRTARCGCFPAALPPRWLRWDSPLRQCSRYTQTVSDTKVRRWPTPLRPGPRPSRSWYGPATPPAPCWSSTCLTRSGGTGPKLRWTWSP